MEATLRTREAPPADRLSGRGSLRSACRGRVFALKAPVNARSATEPGGGQQAELLGELGAVDVGVVLDDLPVLDAEHVAALDDDRGPGRGEALEAARAEERPSDAPAARRLLAARGELEDLELAVREGARTGREVGPDVSRRAAARRCPWTRSIAPGFQQRYGRVEVLRS